MQIKMAGYNAGMRIMADNISNNKTNVKSGNHSMNAVTGNAFGAQCKLTISNEGRKKSEQEKQHTARSAVESQMNRMMIRQQEQTQEYKSEHADTLDEISNLMQSIQSSYEAGEDKETIQKKQDALNRMIELKKRQEEENKQRMKDAMDGVSGSSKAQEEIDRKNEELLMLLKSFEEQEDEDNEGRSGKEGASETADSEQAGAGEKLQESAAMLGASAARRELQTKEAIDGLKNDGYSKLAEVNAIMGEIRAELRIAEEAAGKENLSDNEKEQLVSEHTGTAQAMLAGNYGYMSELRRKGLQEIRDSRELEQRHIEINPLDGVKNAQQAIMDAGADAALQEAASGVLDKASQELEDRVQAAIDKRDDVVSDADKKAEEEAEKEAEKVEEKRAEEEIEEKGEEKNSILNQLII